MTRIGTVLLLLLSSTLAFGSPGEAGGPCNLQSDFDAVNCVFCEARQQGECFVETGADSSPRGLGE